MIRRAAGYLALLLALLPALAGATEAASPPGDDATGPGTEGTTIQLPRGDVFLPLLADPKEPRTFAAWTFTHTNDPTFGDLNVGIAGFGGRWGIVRWHADGAGNGLQLSISGGVFAQFNMDTPSKDLINADYVVGFPLSWRRGDTSARLRLYHQSSHLGDEFLLAEHPERLNLSFESIELIVARRLGFWRIYGGGEYLLDPEPNSLKSQVLHAGIELRHPATVLDLGQFGEARFVAGLDVKSSETQNWRDQVSFQGGLEVVAPDSTGDGAERSWKLLVNAFDGPAPYSQYFTLDVSWVGVGLELDL